MVSGSPSTARDADGTDATTLSRFRAALVLAARAPSRIVFLEDARVGALLSAVVLVASPRHALLGAVAAVAASLSARAVSASRALADSGLVPLNGLFAGLAAATFFPGVGPSLAAAVLAGALAAPTAIALERLLAPWDLPLLVAPYLPAFALVMLGARDLPWALPVAAPVPPPLPSDVVAASIASALRGVGQIVFLPSEAVGAAFLLAVAVIRPRLALVLLAVAIPSAAWAHALRVPGWHAGGGLSVFTPVLVACAAETRFRGFRASYVPIAVLVSPLLESACIRTCGAFGLPALSLAYVVFTWCAILVPPVRAAETRP
ncbi:MAG: urea transporter [Polyangiaceae bacterium]